MSLKPKMRSKYLKDGRFLVYLDQCVLSRFRERSTNGWEDICDLLLSLAERGKILCPVSLEHLMESSQLKDSDIEHLAPLISKLSSDWSLRTEPDLIAEQLMGRLRGIAVNPSSFLRESMFKPLTDAKTLASLRALKPKVDAHNERMMEDVNYVNSITRRAGSKDATVLAWMRARRHETILSRLIARLEESLRRGFAKITADPYSPQLAEWDALIVFNLIEDHHLVVPEARQLIRHLREEHLRFCPTLFIKAELDALQFAKQEKIEARDQYDITHAACAFPYADIYITDGGKAGAIKELKLDSRFATKVFSTKARDLSSILKELEAIDCIQS